MGLFKSKEEKLREKEELREANKKIWLAPYIEKGFSISKSIYIPDYNSKKSEINDACVIIDTENKKWAYTSRKLYESGIVKIYDFNEFVKYDAQRNDNNIDSIKGSGYIIGNMYNQIETGTIKRISYKFVVFTNSNSIDDTSIVLLSQDGYSLTIPEYDNIMEELTKTFEYITNNK